MNSPGNALLIVENNSVPMDRRVWYEATSLRDAGWQVTVICPQDSTEKSIHLKNPQNLEGIKVYRFPLKFASGGPTGYFKEYTQAFFWIFRLSIQVWLEKHFDIIHICNPPEIFFPIGYLFRMLGARFLFDHHDLFPELIRGRYSGTSGKILHLFALWMEFLTYKSANIVITTNEFYRQIALERNRVKAEKIIVVRNGPKIAQFIPTEPVQALKKGYQFMVSFVGIMGEDDGVLEFIEVIRYIVNDLGRRDILFVLIGDGAVRLPAENKLSQYGLRDSVSLPGFIKDDLVLRQYMSTTDIFVSPEPPNPMNNCSTFIKIGEYMAMGKPIVAFDLKETRVTAQEAAVYATPGDIQSFGKFIITLIADPNKRHSMGKIGQQRIQDVLGWEHQVKKLLKVYRMLLNE